MRQGKPSTRYAHLGVYSICLGPNAPELAGKRLQVVIYDKDDNIVRRLEEVKGECVDPGYVDFFLGPNCRPARYRYYLVDIAPDGTQTIIHDDPALLGRNKELWFDFLGKWAKQYGVEQEG